MSKVKKKVEKKKETSSSKRGGKREGAGRKVGGGEKNFPFYCALKESLIVKYGSIENLKKHVKEMLDKEDEATD